MRIKKKLNCILLVDDDESANFLHSEVIKKAGVAEQVHAAENGAEAIDYLTNRGRFTANGKNYPCPDLIFLDINMPVMDGWEFLEEYHKLDKSQKGKIVLVMLTTSLNPRDREAAREFTEVSDYIYKPLTPELFSDVIKQQFPERF